MNLRPFRPDDLAATLEAWDAATQVAHPFLSEAFLTAERRQIAHVWMPQADVTVAEVDEQVVGFIAMVDDEVGGLFLHPDHHGRGIGRALMDHACTSRERVELDVFVDNVIGRRFYERYGFQPVDQSVHTPTGRAQLRLRLDRAGPDEAPVTK